MKPSDQLSTSRAILIGSLLVSLSILISSGVIPLRVAKPNIQGTNGGGATPPLTQTQAAVQPKGEKEIVGLIKTYAVKLGLDQEKFNSCLDSGSKSQIVAADLADGSTAGVNGTPGFFLDGHLISGAQPTQVFKDAIEFELRGGDWTNPDQSVKYLVDGGEVGKTKVSVNVGNLPVLGNPNAKVTLIEFSDYQCPFCGRFFIQTESELRKTYINTGKVAFYYRDFPLSQIHPGAEKGAEAARCAGDQGKYWQFHDLLFSNQDSIFN